MTALLISRGTLRNLAVLIGFALIAIASPDRLIAGEKPNGDAGTVVSLHVFPRAIRIGGINRRQQILVTAERADGSLFDVTHRAKFSVADEHLARIEQTTVQGKADGETTLWVSYQTAKLRVPLSVHGFDTFPPVHFATDVIPVFSKLGCNSGGCHGKQSGQNGFHLSVFGFDPRADFNTLVKAARGRRVFPSDPERSLLLQKMTGRVAHGGGRRTQTGTLDYTIVSQWIAQGMPWGDDNAAKLVSTFVEPTERVMSMNSDQQILVTALYSDGSRRDVTTAAAYTSNAEVVAEVDASGQIHTGKIPGESAITVSYMGQMGVVRLLVPRPNSPEPYPQIPRNNEVDGFVWAKLKKMGIIPSDLANDAAFLRRLYLDAIGTLPDASDVRKFLADKNSEKRSHAIDEVLRRDEFSDYWALQWSDILLVDREALGERGAYEFHRWIREQVANNRPYNEWVHELITASGSSGKIGPVNFFRALRTPEELTRSVSQAFLGVRIDCAQCHHHPFEKWAQEDFYGLAGFFNGLKLKKLSGDREFVYHSGFRETKLPLSGTVVPPRPPGGDVPLDIKDGDPRIHLAKWMTATSNPWFAKLVANRLWKHFLGRGLIEPVDDIRSTNPATNKPLLDFLELQVVENGYDLKAVMRLILNSRVYQLSSVPNETNFDDSQNFSHHIVKRMPAEVLFDAVSHVTGVAEDFVGMPPGTRSIQLWDNRLPSYFLDTFGRSERKSACECGKSNDPTMAQALHLMNAPEIEAKITSSGGRVASFIESKNSSREIVDKLCLIALGRLPNEKEQRVATRLFAEAPPRQAAEDFLWTLLNSYDFLFIK